MSLFHRVLDSHDALHYCRASTAVMILLASWPALPVAQDLPRPEFEVASIRPSAAPAGGVGRAGVQIDGSQVVACSSR
jgi:hypothetical protein